MADTDRTNSRGDDPQLPADHAVDSQTLSWLDGLPHNFEGWGPKTPDADAPDDTVHADSELTWTGEVDERDHHVWSFQRASRRHH
jgi:hypothetical protein